MKACILFHDNCFDGMASAGLFWAFAEARLHPGIEVVLGGLAHGPAGEVEVGSLDSGPLEAGRLVGDLNAIVDFRYLADERLSWWFDHHKSAFSSDDDKRHFEADTSGHKYFDPSAPSCAGLISRVLASEHGFDASAHAELVHWADIIDAARFPDPRTAVELTEPALLLMTWIESSDVFAERGEIVARMIREPLAEVAGAPFVVAGLEPILERHRENIEAMRARHAREDHVFWCDLTDREVYAVNKFIPYHLYPDARYAVVVTRTKSRSKVSVGYSPWAPSEKREHDISELCRRYGGGGHPVVGAVSLPAKEADRAVQVGREIVEVLRS